MDNTFNFKNFDLFGVPIPISYENNYLSRTNVGATLTIISTVIISIYTLFQISTLLDRSSYSVISSEIQDLKGEIDLSNTPIMFTLLDLYYNPVGYDPKLFTFTANYIEATFNIIDGEKKRNTSMRNLEIERCDKLKKEFKNLNEFSEYNLTKFMCIKPNQNIILYGTTTDIHNELKLLEIKVSKCNNNQLNECYDIDMTNNLIENRIFAFSYLGYTSNFTTIYNDKNVKYKIYSSFITFSKYLRKLFVYGFSKGKLTLFDNFFVTYKSEINYFFNQDVYQDFTLIANSSSYSDELISFNFIYDGNLVEHTKDIKGIGPTFSYIMATFNTVIIISRILNDYYGNKILLSNLFKFLKNKDINSHSINKYKSNNENDISKNDLFAKTPINNCEINAKGNFVFNVNNKSSRCIKITPFIKFEEKQKSSYKYSKKDHWKFCIYPYCLIKQNHHLSNIKDEICSIFSVENILKTIRLLKSFNSLRNEFYNQVIENKMVLNSCSKIKGINNDEVKSENFKI